MSRKNKFQRRKSFATNAKDKRFPRGAENVKINKVTSSSPLTVKSSRNKIDDGIKSER